VVSSPQTSTDVQSSSSSNGSRPQRPLSLSHLASLLHQDPSRSNRFATDPFCGIFSLVKNRSRRTRSISTTKIAIRIGVYQEEDITIIMPPSDSNATFITSTVIIRVTPQQDHLVSWSILGVCFFVAIVVGVYQVWKEYQLLTITQQQNRSSSPRRHSNEHNHGYAGYGDVESQAINEAGVSTADLTRCMVCSFFVPLFSLSLFLCLYMHI
jgi:hypothetical protein